MTSHAGIVGQPAFRRLRFFYSWVFLTHHIDQRIPAPQRDGGDTLAEGRIASVTVNTLEGGFTVFLVELVMYGSKVRHGGGSVIECKLGTVVVGCLRHRVAAYAKRIMFLKRTRGDKTDSAQHDQHEEANPGDNGPASAFARGG